MVKRTNSRRSVRRKAAPKRKATKRKAPAKRKATKRKATKRKAAPKRKATKRKAPAKRKATKRKTTKRKAKRSTPKKPRYSLLITQSQRNSRDFKVQVLKNGKVAGEPKKIAASKISATASGIINYARRKRVNLAKAWDSVA